MITPRTTGIVGVHLWGRGAPVDELQAIADEHGLKLMFDAAHAFGCSYQGKMIGNFGFSGLNNVVHPGTNGKMIEVSAAMGLVNLDAIDDVVAANRRNHHAYREALANLRGINLLIFNEVERNNYQYVVMEVSQDCPVPRDLIIEALHAENIRARKYFWPSCHNMQPYRELYPHAGLLLLNTQQVANRVVVLPTGTTMTVEMVNAVAAVIRVLIEG
jgi:dTDP-4-amino-4,6-dideoxygalactose transaminase